MTELVSFRIQFCIVMRHFLEWKKCCDVLCHSYVHPASIWSGAPLFITLNYCMDRDVQSFRKTLILWLQPVLPYTFIQCWLLSVVFGCF